MLVVDSTFKRLHFHKYTILTSDYRDLTDFFCESVLHGDILSNISCPLQCWIYANNYNLYWRLHLRSKKAIRVPLQQRSPLLALTSIYILVLGSWNIIMVMVTRCWGSNTIRQQYVLWLDISLLVVPLSVFLDGRFLFILPYTYISL